MANNITNLGQQIAIIAGMKDMQGRMSTLQEQISTGVKHQRYSEYGTDALRILNYRSDLQSKTAFSDNINIGQINIKQMNTAVEESIKQATNVLESITKQLTKGNEFNLESIKGAANTALQVIQANLNAQVGERYLFAGSDVSNPPYNGSSTATANIQTEVKNWLDGTTTDTDAFISNVSNLTPSQLGFSLSVQSSKGVSIRADDNLEVDYTVKATDPGFQKLIAGLNVLANLNQPTTGDIPTSDNFYDAVNRVYQLIKEGTSDLQNSETVLASAASVLDSTLTQHQNDQNSIQKTMDSVESTDVSAAIVTFQGLQSQLEASYQLTSILSQLSLARIL